MTEEKDILAALAAMEERILRHMDETAAKLGAIEKRQAGQERVMNRHDARLHALEEIVRGLLDDREAVVRRDGRYAVVRKEALYDAAAARGIWRRDVLRELERHGMLRRQPSAATRTWVAHDPVTRKSFRAVLIVL